jgi:hypothetical protein
MLLAITPGDGRDLVPWLAELEHTGLEALLWREPNLPSGDNLALLRRLPMGVVHWRCGTVSGLRTHRQEMSSHSVAEAAGVRAPYVLLSPIWRPTSKPNDARPTLGLSAIRRALATAQSPVLALGGVTPRRYRQLVELNAGAAVLGDLFGQCSPQAAAKRLRAYSVDSSSSS